MNMVKKNRTNKKFLLGRNIRNSSPSPLVLKNKRLMLLEHKLSCDELYNSRYFSTTLPLNNKVKNDKSKFVNFKHRVLKSIKQTFTVKKMLTVLISLCIG